MRRFKSTVFRSIMKFFKRKKRLSETRLFERKNDLTAWRHGVERIPKNEREKTAVSVYVLPPLGIPIIITNYFCGNKSVFAKP